MRASLLALMNEATLLTLDYYFPSERQFASAAGVDHLCRRTSLTANGAC